MATYTITLNERTTSGKAIKKSAMRHLCSKLLLTALISMLCATSFAHDIEVANSDGVKIYYNYNSKLSGLTVTFRGDQCTDYWYEYSGNVVIPESVTHNGNTYIVKGIGKEAFWGCSGLTSVTIPESVTSIGQSAFSSCSSLTSVTIPNGVTSIEQSAFSGCSSLTTVTIPNSVTSISQYAFNNCSGLTSVTIPNSVTTIGERTFYNCSSLTSVTIGNSVTSIGQYAFNGCSSLTSVIIPNSVTTIGERTFYNCSSLTNVTIPNSVTSIGSAAFYNCSNLTAVKVGMENPVSITSGTFSNRTNAILYVPRGSKEAYEAANYWKEFKEIVEYAPVILLDETSVDDPASYPVTMDVKVQRTIKGGEWNTICLPFAMTGEQAAEALGSVELADFIDYQATKKGDKTISIMINFTPVSAADGMEANHPYLIKTADDIDEFTVSEVMLVPDEENAQTAFTTEEDGQTVSKGYMKGIYHAQTVVPADNLFVSANKFYYSTGKTKMMAYRAYFYLADRLDRNESASAKISFMFNESSTNRIEDVEVRPAASSAIFDIQGRKVADSADGLQGLPKGIYIINGKKVVR